MTTTEPAARPTTAGGTGAILELRDTVRIHGQGATQVRALPRIRRIVGGAQAVVIGLMGTALGVTLGFVPGIAVTWPLTAQTFVCNGQAQCVHGGGPVITIPWLLLGIIVIAVPVVAGLVAGLFTRSRLPMIRRLAT